ncbi:MAG: hypothetical protein ABI584_01820, partial [Acidobacteriota bacterium]
MKKSLVTPLLLALLAAPVFAQESTDTDKRIRDLEKQVEALQKKDAAKAADKAAKPAAEAKTEAKAEGKKSSKAKDPDI